ncbi:hypothetical protein Tco_1418762 [Tanacetum coccineum]
MTTTYWRADPKTREMIGPLDEEELAKNMWRTICRVRGLPVDATYVINNDYQNMTWSEKTCDGLWRNVYRKRDDEETKRSRRLMNRRRIAPQDCKEEDRTLEKPLMAHEGALRSMQMKKTPQEGDKEAAKDS